MLLTGVLAATWALAGLPVHAAVLPSHRLANTSLPYLHTVLGNQTGGDVKENKWVRRDEEQDELDGKVHVPDGIEMAKNDYLLCFNMGPKAPRKNLIYAIDAEVCKGIGRAFVSGEEYNWYYNDPDFVINIKIGPGNFYDPGEDNETCKKELRKIVDICDQEAENNKQGGILTNQDRPWQWSIRLRDHGHLQGIPPCTDEQCSDKFWNSTEYPPEAAYDKGKESSERMVFKDMPDIYKEWEVDDMIDN
ncbi:hypothetical protein K490DRAFT_53565 [Saccharata proteae CBS 121410]|uniref:Uncharacterized protein n=1 Tax=Saccharata proteae CBS 121410 TaxID=1314787 RepID=A0A9P4LZ20_9PEZI|nr:hypothetical protein K490DRAFT_53565 [Saccharata proteae CBS 121410]